MTLQSGCKFINAIKLVCLLQVCQLRAQVPFTCEGQTFVVLEGSYELAELKVNPANNSLQIFSITSLGVPVHALGFRQTDRFLYGLDVAGHTLYRIDAAGNVDAIASLPLGGMQIFLAGDVTPDGKYFVAIGSQNGNDEILVRIDLEDPGFATQSIPMNSSSLLADIAYDPASNLLWGYDETGNRLVTLNAGTGTVTGFNPLPANNGIQGILFDAFADLYGIGSTAFGVSSALFSVSKANGSAQIISTGPVISILDAASCPYSVEVRNSVDPAISFPCGEIEYTLSVANRSGQTLNGIILEQVLPAGFQFSGVQQNVLGGTLDMNALPGTVRIENITLPTGIRNLVYRVTLDDIPAGVRKSQAVLRELPDYLGSSVFSNDPVTAPGEDSTALEVVRFDEDSIFFTRLLCQGETTLLDGSIYGNSVQWNTGFTGPELSVSQAGLYFLNANSGCQELYVGFEVTTASCPFTIELSHIPVPDTIFPCNEAVYRFYLDNDSGESRTGVSFIDTLPEGFLFVDVLRNPYGGIVETDLPSGHIRIRDMFLSVGLDSIDLLVEAGDVVPGQYANRARIEDLPVVLGPFRFSDDPRTLLFDSTDIVILGTDSDTVNLEGIICPGEQIVLDASSYGKNFIWSDGSSGSSLTISGPGLYVVQLFDGCDPGEVRFLIEGAPGLLLDLSPDAVEVRLGEPYRLDPVILNEGDSLWLEWTDPPGNTLSCLDCPDPIAFTLESTVYTLYAANEFCEDTASLEVRIDKSRRVFAPNVFSPNGDGINDFFFLQSPDFGIVESFLIADRWGKVVFDSGTHILNEPGTGWDGMAGGRKAAAGIYTWRARIRFLDQVIQTFYGDVAILK